MGIKTRAEIVTASASSLAIASDVAVKVSSFQLPGALENHVGDTKHGMMAAYFGLAVYSFCHHVLKTDSRVALVAGATASGLYLTAILLMETTKLLANPVEMKNLPDYPDLAFAAIGFFGGLASKNLAGRIINELN